MTRIATMHSAVNLAQGFPDFPMPDLMKDAACTAINGNVNQYAVTWGAPVLRQAIAEKYRRWYDMEVDADRDVTVTCGATEAMATVFMALMEPGDEVIILEPFYENYGPDAILAGAHPVFVPFERPDWTLDADRLRKAFTSRTKAIIVNTPHNPTGRVLSREELSLIADLCIEHNAWAITDGPYEHMVYSGHHHEIATWPGMRERTITISSLSKTLETYFSTDRNVITSRSAIPWFERPSAMSSRTSRSRGVSSIRTSSLRRLARSVETMIGSIAEPPSATRSTAATNSLTSLIRSLSRYPAPSAESARSFIARPTSTYCERTRTPTVG